MKLKGKDKLMVVLAASASALPIMMAMPAAQAQETAVAQDEDVVIVSARRRDESLQDVPVAVTAVGGATLENQGVQDITYLAQSVPNTTLKVSRGTNSTLTAFIRGVGQQDPVAGFESGVGIYLDDVYLNRPQGAVLDVYDVERIEILRGPQGTLYGRNTVGGAVKYVTKGLASEPTARLRASAGSFGQIDVVATASTPLSDNVRIGGSVARLTRDGYGKNLTTGKENYDKDVTALRGSMEIDNGPLEIKISGDYLKDKSSPKGGHRLVPGRISGAPVLDDVFDSRGGLTGKNEAEAYGGALHVTYEINDQWTLKNILAYREDESFQTIDFDALPAADLDVPVIYKNEQTTEEFQLLYTGDQMTGVLGFYYIDANAFNSFDVVLDVVGTSIGLPGLNANTTGDVSTESWSVFGDFTFDLEKMMGAQGWELSIGGRYTNDKREATVLRRTFRGNTEQFGGTNPILLATTSNFTGEKEFTDFSPRVSLAYSPNSLNNFYASYSQGFKGGGFDPRGQSSAVTIDFDNDGDVDADDIFEFFLFDPEEVDSYELGWKMRSEGGRFTSNLAVFFAEYTDVQIPGSQGGRDPLTNAPTFIGVTTNAGAAEFRGIEWEGTFDVAENMFKDGDDLSIAWGGGIIDAEYTEFLAGNPPADVSNIREIQNTPKFSGALTTNYTVPADMFNRGGDISFITQTSYKSETHQFEVPNEFLDQGGYTLLDASLVWNSEDGRLQLGLHGKNLTDKEYRVAGYNFIAQQADGTIVEPITPTLGAEGTITAFYGAPRTITATLQIDF